MYLGPLKSPILSLKFQNLCWFLCSLGVIFPRSQTWLFSTQLLLESVSAPGEKGMQTPSVHSLSLWGFHVFTVLFSDPLARLCFLSTVNLRKILLCLSEMSRLTHDAGTDLEFSKCPVGKTSHGFEAPQVSTCATLALCTAKCFLRVSQSQRHPYTWGKPQSSGSTQD